LIRLLLLLILSLQLNALAASSYTANYSKYKKEYFASILKNDKVKEIKSLKRLIYYAKKLNKPTYRYRKELKLLASNIKKINIYKNKKNKKSRYKKYTIKSIEVRDNLILINFKNKVSRRLISFNEERSGGYYRDNFDIKGMINGVNKLKLKMPKVNSLSKIVVYKKTRNTMRLSLRSKYHNLKTVYFFQDNRITIKVVEDVKLKKAKVYPTIIANNSRKKIIVIDPGHGGRDTGAQGPHKRYEKKSVLMVAKTLRYILKSRGYTVYMTRDSDTYKTLKYRTSYANHKNADLFISIHANAVPKRKRNRIFGIETYYLSPARSERAKRVALQENQMNVQSLNYSTKNIFLMTQNRAKITASNKLAVDVQSNILYNLKDKYKYIKDNGVKKGPFWVLVGVQMPSILVEIGYISHYRESIRLYNSSYQNLLARGIANGIDDYFRKNQ